jgi:dimethylargininase
MLALTHVPSPQMGHGERTHVARVPIDHELALRQHREYCQTLRDCGAGVRTLDVNRDRPDGVFIEDTAVILDEVAVLGSMGTETRRTEPAAMEPVLREYRPVRRIEPPATLEGGDVLCVGRSLLVGVSSRTNAAGVHALEAIVRRYGYRVLPVPVRGCLHLKTACTALPDHRLLVNPAWLAVEPLQGFETILIPADEPWGANTLPVAGAVCIAAEFPQTADLLRQRGFEVRMVGLSEFAKAEGGVTCLSLLVGDP